MLTQIRAQALRQHHEIRRNHQHRRGVILRADFREHLHPPQLQRHRIPAICSAACESFSDASNSASALMIRARFLRIASARNFIWSGMVASLGCHRESESGFSQIDLHLALDTCAAATGEREYIVVCAVLIVGPCARTESQLCGGNNPKRASASRMRMRLG